jgi:hypothetical protein
VSTLRFGKRAVQAALALTLLGFAAPAGAYCRTTTCDPEVQNCDVCEAPGIPLYWKSSCVSFTVQQDGSPKRDISYDEANSIIADAFGRWQGAQCPFGKPDVEIADLGAVTCAEPQYNQTDGNSNVWMFRDDEWPYEDPNANDFVATSALAVTAVTYNPETGEIYDADVEINSLNVPLTTGDTSVKYDLASIVTHEAGHFLGLNHSLDDSATMAAGYISGDVGMRTLSPDDEAGICSIYSPDRPMPSDSCTPRHGFSGECAAVDTGCCSTAPGRPTPADARGPWLSAFVAGLLGLVIARRRGRLAPS